MTIDVSKTWDFNPSLGSLLLTAFQRCQLRPTTLTAAHIAEGQKAANFILAEISNVQPNLWVVGLQTVPLLSGTGTYTVPAETVMILDLYVSYGTPSTDRYLYPISRTEYSAYPNKDQEGFPNVYWFDRLISPTITLWPVPDDNGPYIVKYYSVRQTMDAVMAGGKTVEVPYRFLDMYVSGLAWKLSELYAPMLEERLLARYERSKSIANTQDVEGVALYISPGLSGYYR